MEPVAELRELLHDAEEGLRGFDAITVIKPFLGKGFRELSSRLENAVFLRYGLPHWTPEAHLQHKKADRLAAASEAVHVAGWTPTEVRNTLKIRVTPLDIDPLLAMYGGVAWEPWSPTVAAERFLAELNRLQYELASEPQHTNQVLDK